VIVNEVRKRGGSLAKDLETGQRGEKDKKGPRPAILRGKRKLKLRTRGGGISLRASRVRETKKAKRNNMKKPGGKCGEREKKPHEQGRG